MRFAIVLAVFGVGSLSHGDSLGNILPLGDSLTGGVSTGAPNSYRGPLDAMLSASGHSYSWVGPQTWGPFPSGHENKHAGFGGWDIDELLNGKVGQEFWGNLTHWLDAQPVDTMLFTVPVNGFWRWEATYLTSPSTRDEARSWQNLRIRQVLDRGFAKYSSMQIYLGSLATQANNPTFNAYAADMDQLVREIVTEYQGQGRVVRHVDVFGTIDSAQHIIADGTHWNDAGASAVANAYFSEIQSVPEPSMVAGLVGIALLALRKRTRTS